MNSFERWVANHFCSKQPKDVTFQQLLTLIEDDSSDVTIWEPFENFDKENITEWMEKAVDSLELTFIPKPEKA